MSNSTLTIHRKNSFFSGKELIYLSIVCLLALLARMPCFSFQSNDYNVFLKPWFDEIKANGGFAAIGRPIGDYLPSYIYILAALTYLPLNSLYSIKLVSFIGDIFLAYFAMRITRIASKRCNSGYFVFAAVLFLPTVYLNSGTWAQCDSLYTSALLAFAYYAIQNKPAKAMLSYSIAFIFKIQAVFLAPVVLLLLIKKKIKFSQLFIVPITYTIVIMPAFLCGRNMLDLLTVYFRLAGSYSALSLNAPNFYAFIHAENTLVFSVAGILIFLALLTAFFLWLSKKDFEITTENIIHFALLSSLAVPFLLPHMHERYFYAADIFSLIFVALQPKKWPIAAITVSSSFLVYGIYLFNFTWMNAAYAAVPMFIVLCIIFTRTIKVINTATT